MWEVLFVAHLIFKNQWNPRQMYMCDHVRLVHIHDQVDLCVHVHVSRGHRGHHSHHFHDHHHRRHHHHHHHHRHCHTTTIATCCHPHHRHITVASASSSYRRQHSYPPTAWIAGFGMGNTFRFTTGAAGLDRHQNAAKRQTSRSSNFVVWTHPKNSKKKSDNPWQSWKWWSNRMGGTVSRMTFKTNEDQNYCPAASIISQVFILHSSEWLWPIGSRRSAWNNLWSLLRILRCLTTVKVGGVSCPLVDLDIPWFT